MQGTVTFHFPSFRRRLDIEVLLCVCRLDKVLFLCSWCIAVYFKFLAWKAPHCTLYHAENLVFFSILAMIVDDIDTYFPSAVVNFQRLDGSLVSAKIVGPSKCSTDNWSITYECSGTVVTHECAPIAQMSFLRVRTPPRPTSASTTTNREERRQTRKKAQLKLGAKNHPHPPLPLMRRMPCSSVVNLAPLWLTVRLLCGA